MVSLVCKNRVHVLTSDITGIKTGFCQKLWKARGVSATIKIWLDEGLHKYRFVHTPIPYEKVSLQIYTDLKNGPKNWEKLWRF